ncbi:MAG: BREX system P-loop protein BrxC, partial [Planctomycetes bacterium]|nr:BREX system P-loop protein BrxC [Planctomycetota bacterium]
MNTIGDLLARDLRKKIVEIIQVDDTDEQAVYDEITEYVATHRIKEQYRTLLQAMADMPRQPHDGVGVWISGFFGSGKSSFAKNLGYALANPTVCGHPAAELFKEQLADPGLADMIDFLNRQVPCEVVMFDVSKASEVRRGDEKIAEVVYRALLRKFDYALDFDIADLEIWLEEQGKLEDFVALCPQVNEGLDWRRARKGALKINFASTILHALDPVRFPDAETWARSVPSRHVTITVQTVVERAFQFAARRGQGKALVIIIDEVGQYVARSSAKIEDLRALVEEFGQAGKNLVRQRKAIAPAWFVVTAQEKLEEVVDALESRRVDKAKMQDRFKYRIDLAPADIREVATRRVLAKKPEAVPLLRQRYQRDNVPLQVATRLERSAIRSDVGEKDFLELYPYLPQHIDLSIAIMSGIRLQPGAPRQLGGSCRTIIKQAYEMLKSPRTALAEKPVGALVTLDRIFELVEGNLPTEKQKDISDIAARFAGDPEDAGLAARVARVVCLLEYVRGLARTDANIAACLVDEVGRPSPKAAVGRALERLQELQFVRNTEEGWKLQTAQEKNWDTERRTHLDPRPRDRQEIIRDLLRELFSEPRLKTYRYRDLKSFRVGLRVDGQPVEDGQLVLLVTLADDAESFPARFEEARADSRQQSHKNDLFWVAALTPEIDRLVANLYASQQMIAKYRQLRAQQKISHDEGACLDAEDLEAQRLRGQLRAKLAEALERGKGLRHPGIESDGADLGKALPEVLRKFFDLGVPELYRKLEMAPSSLEGNEAEDFLKATRLDTLPEVFHAGEEGLNLVVQEGTKFVPNREAEIAREVFGFLTSQHQYGNKVTGKVLEEHFGGVPYGWDRDVLRLVLAVLLRAGVLEVAHQGRRFRSHTDPQCRAPFTSHTAFRAASFAPWKSIDLKTLTLAAQQLEELTGDEADVEEGALAGEFKKLADEEQRHLLPALAL